MSRVTATGAPAFSAHEAQNSPRSKSFVDDITIQHGPTGLMGRFFLASDAYFRERGVTVSFGTFQEILAANEANRDSWKPLFPSYHPDYHTFNADNSFAFIGRDKTGKVVLTQAGILFRLNDTTFHDFASALRVNYDDPDKMKRPGEKCIPTAPSLKIMRGNVLFGGATWFHPSVRGAGLTEVTTRTSRAYGYTRFKTDYSTSFMVSGPLNGGMAKRAGFPNVEWGIDFENSPMGNFSCAFCWLKPDYLLEDLERFVTEAAPQVDAGVRERRA